MGNTTTLARGLLAAAPLALALVLAACGGDDDGSPANPGTPNTGTPTPPGTPAQTSRNVGACLSQEVIPGSGLTPASLVIPDTLKLDITKPAGFPNGRLLADPTPDVTLAVVLLDMKKHDPSTFARLPLNPPTNDRPFLDVFPFAAPPQGTPPLAPSTGTVFNFRTNAFTEYVRVDREGMPAVSAALIGADMKNAYNDADPADDAAGRFTPELIKQLTVLHDGLADDLIALGLTPCSTAS